MTDVLDGNAVGLGVLIFALLAIGVLGPPLLLEHLQTALVEQPQDGVVELVAQRRSVLDGHGVRLARKVLAHHLQVALDHHLVTDVRCVSLTQKKKKLKKN